MLTAIQYMGNFGSENEARSALVALALQNDYIGGRVLAPAKLGWWEVPSTKELPRVWRVQAFFRFAGAFSAGQTIGDGLRIVMIPESIARQCGVNVEMSR